MRVPTQLVRTLRHSQTEAERAAWHLLRDRRQGLKFRRQHRIDRWIVDFYCFEKRLAIELDGGAHSQPSQLRRDAAKDACLTNLGIKLLRIPNGLVLEDPEAFLRKVREAAGMSEQVRPHPARSG
jgi:very-short-patch-repair endonuclease